MDPVNRQYEAYPYPDRDPADEAKRLVVGSPSHPVEIDHFLFGGRRDWSRPFRALVAGGGTGDAAIMLGALLRRVGAPAEIHYLDLSTASRRIAEARAAARGLDEIAFHTGDLRDAARLGPFDYIDCCGVLHHLDEPQEGFAALAAALSPDGGLGAMVYAPHGRSGVYVAQAALAALTADADAPAEKVRRAEIALARMPETHALKLNPRIGDHRAGPAGLYDLLLHARDRPMEAGEVVRALDRAGLALAGWTTPARYDPRSVLGPDCGDPAMAAAVDALDAADRATLAERLAGDLKTHVFYAAPAARGATAADDLRPDLTPVLLGAPPAALARSVAASGRIAATLDGRRIEAPIEKAAAGLIAAIDGRTPLAALQSRSGLDWFAFAARVRPIVDALGGFNLLRFSTAGALQVDTS